MKNSRSISWYPEVLEAANLQLEQTNFPVVSQHFQIPCVFPDRKFIWPFSLFSLCSGDPDEERVDISHVRLCRYGRHSSALAHGGRRLQRGGWWCGESTLPFDEGLPGFLYFLPTLPSGYYKPAFSPGLALPAANGPQPWGPIPTYSLPKQLFVIIEERPRSEEG